MSENRNKPYRYTNLYVKRRLLKLEIDIFGIMAKFLRHELPLIQMQHQVQDLIHAVAVQLKLSQAEVAALWKKFQMQLQSYRRSLAWKIRKTQTVDQKNDLIYASIRANVQDGSLIKESNQVMRLYEERMKDEELNLLIADHSSPFYLCTAHPNPAKDHADWQGKMYYDEDWESYVDDPEIRDHIRAYIRNHKLRSVQWVTGAPVWLIRRPNCRHALYPIPVQDVLHNSVKKLLKSNNMILDNKKPASRRVLTYRQYYNRLKVEEALNELIPNERLKQDITQSKRMVQKWA